MPQAFHATLDARAKRYRYVIDNARIADPFQLRYSWHVPPAARRGRDGPRRRSRSRAATTSTASRPTGPTGRAASGRSWTLPSNRRTTSVRIDVEADGFLYNMVRSIAGTLVLVGKGKRPESWVAEVLAAQDRRRGRAHRAAARAVPGRGPLSRRRGPTGLDADRPHHHAADPGRGPGEHPADGRGPSPPLSATT